MRKETVIEEAFRRPPKMKKKKYLLLVMICFGVKTFVVHLDPSASNPRVLLEANESLPVCPKVSPLHHGTVVINLNSVQAIPSESEEFRERFGDLKPGGKFTPQNCIARQTVAIIVPYRNRIAHLKTFTYFLHPILQRQQIDYQIFIIEQSGMGAADFNRGALMNVGYAEALKENENFDCFIFHDVDLIPEDDRIVYNCFDDKVKHLSVAIKGYTIHDYKLIYHQNFGGATAMSKVQFERANGFSNKFYGWGGEDDDLYRRVVLHLGIPIFRYPGNVGRYTMLLHGKAKGNSQRYTLVYGDSIQKQKKDGIANLRYNRIDKKLMPLYTIITVQLPKNS